MFVILDANQPTKIRDLVKLLKLNKIEFGSLSSGKQKSIKNAYDYIERNPLLIK